MKRFSLMFVAVGLIGLTGLMVAGCGQAIPQVSTTSSQPKGLTIRGIVFGENLSGNQSVPLAGAILYLAGDKVNKTTVSDADGQYSFTDLPSNNTSSGSGGYTIIATREGYQRTIIARLKFGSDSTAPVPDNSVMTEDITMINNPVVMDISPIPGATIEAGVNTIMVQFNEAMDASSVRPALTSQGMRSFAIADTQTLTTTWSADSKTLYITTGALLANKFYRFMLDPGIIAKDLAGNLVDTTGSGDGWGAGGLSVSIYNNTWESHSYDYRTASGGAPGAPTGILLTVHDLATIDYWDVNLTNSVDLSWLAPSSGVISGYRVYGSTGSSGPWALLDDAGGRNTDTILVTDVNDALYGGRYNADCIRQLAFVTDTVYFRVAAYNAEGETTSETVAMRDSVKPTITAAPAAVDRNPANAGIASVYAALTNFADAAAAATLNKGCYVRFSEPMNLATLTDPTKYTITSGSSPTVTAATVVFNDNGVTIVKLDFSVAIAAPMTDTVTVSTSGPTDLSNNVMSSTGNTATIL